MVVERSKRALVHSERDVAHELGYVGEWLDARGYQVERIYRDHSGDPVEFPQADLFINLGSLSSVAQGYTLDSAHSEITAVKNWIESGSTYVGICYGAQILARALGGQVERQASMYRALEIYEQPQNLGPWVRWHEDFITDAGTAQVHSQSDDAIMIFSEGNAWGIQPHLELTPETLNRLAESVKAQPEQYESLISGLSKNEATARESTYALLDQIMASNLKGGSQ